MAFDPKLNKGDVLSNQDLMDTFGCSNSGGMRRSHDTNTLLIISDHTKSLYDDVWIGDEFHYTGMGQKGDQSLSFAQNKTLQESDKNGISIHWFEVFKRKEYVYQGEVYLAKKPYQDTQLDQESKERKVWIFPLKLKDGKPFKFPEQDIEKVFETRVKQVKKKTKQELINLAEKKKNLKSSKRETISITYDRDPAVVEYALLRSKGNCQLCEEPAPFQKKNGEPYLEVHHIIYMANGGSDTVDNVAALCPNCHRKMHTLENKKDIEKLKKLAILQLGDD